MNDQRNRGRVLQGGVDCVDRGPRDGNGVGLRRLYEEAASAATSQTHGGCTCDQNKQRTEQHPLHLVRVRGFVSAATVAKTRLQSLEGSIAPHSTAPSGVARDSIRLSIQPGQI